MPGSFLLIARLVLHLQRSNFFLQLFFLPIYQFRMLGYWSALPRTVINIFFILVWVFYWALLFVLTTHPYKSWFPAPAWYASWFPLPPSARPALNFHNLSPTPHFRPFSWYSLHWSAKFLQSGSIGNIICPWWVFIDQPPSLVYFWFCVQGHYWWHWMMS